MIPNNLFENPLFKNSNIELMKELLSNGHINISCYKKDSIVVQEYQQCKCVSFVLNGSLYISEISEDGDILYVKLCEKNDSFGCSLYGSKNKNYPFTLIAHEDSQIIHIPFDQIRKMLEEDMNFMNNFIEMLSNNVLFLRDKVKILNSKNVRTKLMFYFYKNIKDGITKINHTKTELSKILGIARGSISRELKSMEEENVISFIDKTTLKILI